MQIKALQLQRATHRTTNRIRVNYCGSEACEQIGILFYSACMQNNSVIAEHPDIFRHSRLLNYSSHPKLGLQLPSVISVYFWLTLTSFSTNQFRFEGFFCTLLFINSNSQPTNNCLNFFFICKIACYQFIMFYF